MARKVIEKYTVEDLQDLIPLYAWKKSEADECKKAADGYSSAIKAVMEENHLKSFCADNITVTRVVSERETLDQNLLLQVAEKYNMPVTKTVTVVDMSLLENYLYDAELTDEQAEDLAKCKSVTEVVSLRIKKES